MRSLFAFIGFLFFFWALVRMIYGAGVIITLFVFKDYLVTPMKYASYAVIAVQVVVSAVMIGLSAYAYSQPKEGTIDEGIQLVNIMGWSSDFVMSLLSIIPYIVMTHTYTPIPTVSQK